MSGLVSSAAVSLLACEMMLGQGKLLTFVVVLALLLTMRDRDFQWGGRRVENDAEGLVVLFVAAPTAMAALSAELTVVEALESHEVLLAPLFFSRRQELLVSLFPPDVCVELGAVFGGGESVIKDVFEGEGNVLVATVRCQYQSCWTRFITF